MSQPAVAVPAVREFLSHILPSAGPYFVVYLWGKDGRKQVSANTLDQICNHITIANANKQNLYIATASYKTKHNRTKDNVALRRCLVADLDCGADKPFSDKAHAAAAIRAYCTATGFPSPSIVVNSGYGLHLYWVFDSDIDVPSWQVLANAFAETAREHQFHIDQGSTVDATRILRMPGTFNWKYGACKPSTVTGLHAVYKYADLMAALHRVPPSEKVDNSDIIGGAPGQNISDEPRHAHLIADECLALKEAVATGGKDHAEPYWNSLLWLLVFCEDGHEYAHLVSKQHPHYKPADTDHKIQLKAQAHAAGGDNGPGPTTCATLNRYTTQCQSCPHWGKVKTPLVLGREVGGSVSETVPPFPYVAYKGTMCAQTDDGMEEILPWIIARLQVIISKENESVTLRVDIKLPRGVVQVRDLYLEHMSDSKTFRGSKSGLGFILSAAQVKALDNIVISWAQKLQAIGKAKIVSTNCGWGTTDARTSFNTGGILHVQGGGTAPAVITSNGDTKGVGSLDEWKKAASLVIDRGDPGISCLLGSGFAAPLVPFTGQAGCVLSVTSPETGTGKSLAMKTAAAIWGHPIRYVNAMDDTHNSLMERMGYLNNLPMYWDEVRLDDDALQFVRTVFRTAQGRGKARLNANSTQRAIGMWATLMAVAGNKALLPVVMDETKATNAGQARLLELPVYSLPPDTDSALGLDTEIALTRNYGLAREPYAQYLVKNRKAVEKAVRNRIKAIGDTLKLGPEERFRVATLATLTVGMRIANNLGLTNFPVQQCYQFATKYLTYENADEEIKQQLNPDDRALRLFHDFLEYQQAHTFVVDGMSGTGRINTSTYKVTTLPLRDKDKPAVCRNIDGSCIIATVSALRYWLTQTQRYSYEDFLISMKRKSVKVTRYSTRWGRGIPTIAAATARVVQFELPASIQAALDATE